MVESDSMPVLQTRPFDARVPINKALGEGRHRTFSGGTP